MNPTILATLATPGQGRTLDSLRHSLLANNPGNEPVAALSMTREGRVVRLSEYPDEQRPALSQTLTAQLQALTAQQEPGSTQPESQAYNRAYKTLRNYAETISPRASPVAGPLTANRTAESERQGDNQRLRQKLEQAKLKHSEKFAYLRQKTETKPLLNNWLTYTTKPHITEIGVCTFSNRYTPDAWYFLINNKPKHMDKTAFYMSNVIILQLEQAFATNGWPLTYPDTIHQCNITNTETIEILEKFHGRYDTPEFMAAFLKTDNGKSTAWIAHDLGMEIDRWTVTFDGGRKPADSYTTKENIEFHCAGSLSRFTVVAHVSPGDDQQE